MSNNPIPIIACPVLNPSVNPTIPVVSSKQKLESAPIPKFIPSKEKLSFSQKPGDIATNLKIENVLKFGNIYAALKAKYLTGVEVMVWLKSIIDDSHKPKTNVKISLVPYPIREIKSLIRVYRAICINSPEEAQLDNHGHHFLDNKSGDMSPYRQIYILTHLSQDFYGNLDSTLGIEAIKILQEKHSPLISEHTSSSPIGDSYHFFKNHRAISKDESKSALISDHIKCAINEEYFDWVYHFSWSQLLQANASRLRKKILLTEIKRRSIEIKKAVPDYWDHVTKKGFLPILEKLNLNLAQKVSFHQIYPELCPEISELSPLSLKILSLESSFLRGYLLGFPIDRYLPRDNELLTAALNLSKLGMMGYSAFLTIHNQKRIESICRNPGLPSGWHIPETTPKDLSSNNIHRIDLSIMKLDQIKENPLNTINLSKVDKIAEFSSFDRISVQSGNGFHFFTRSSFEYLLKTKKNPYNKQPLDPGTLVLLEDRIKRANLMRLPECKTLPELLVLVKSDKISMPQFDHLITSFRPILYQPRVQIPIQNLSPTYYSITSGNTPIPATLGNITDTVNF